METNKPKLSRRALLTYGFGDAGFQFVVNLELFYFSLFLTDYCKFAPAVAGMILTITSIIDCVWVPTAGAIVEKSNYRWMKWGKYRSWLLVGPPITFFAFIPMFLYVPGPLAPWIIGFGFVASHLIWNIVYTAQLSLINVMTDDPYERTKLSANRQVGATIAKIIFGYIVLTTILKIGTAIHNPPMGFTIGAMIFPLLMIGGYYIVFWGSKGYDNLPPVLCDATKAEQKENVPVSTLLRETFKNGQVMLLMGADLFRCFAYYLVTSTAIYYFRKIFGNVAHWALYLVVLNAVSFVGTIIAAPIAKKIGKKNTYVAGVFLYAAALLITYEFAAVDVFFIVAVSVGTMMYQLSLCMITAMFADTVTYGEWKSGKNIRGFIMGLVSMPIKISVFIRSAVIGAILTAICYVPDVPATALEIFGIRRMVALLPAVASIIAGLLIAFFYKLTDRKMIQYAKEIKQRETAPETAEI